MKKVKKTSQFRGGFTLIEILLAIGILAILATAAIIAINPARQFALARNAQRWNDVHAVMNAVYQYSVSNKGALPPEITVTVTEMCLTGASDCTNLANMMSLTDGSIYLTSIPVDPSCPTNCTANGTGYLVSLNDEGRVVVEAAHPELDEDILLIR